MRSSLVATTLFTGALKTVSSGKERPQASGPGEEAWIQNRRAGPRRPGHRRPDGLEEANP